MLNESFTLTIGPLCIVQKCTSKHILLCQHFNLKSNQNIHTIYNQVKTSIQNLGDHRKILKLICKFEDLDLKSIRFIKIKKIHPTCLFNRFPLWFKMYDLVKITVFVQVIWVIYDMTVKYEQIDFKSSFCSMNKINSWLQNDLCDLSP